MKPNSPTIPKHPELKAAEDYYRLRRDGIGFIAELGSRLWTDYNTHDPGITLLENLCYALTDLAYRTGWDIKDLLAPAVPAAKPEQPFPQQAFFTAREILPVNPVTPDDFRRLLIDRETVRNAWIFCRQCACDVRYYAFCEQDRLLLSYRKPAPQLQPKKVAPQGLYEVLLELEADPLLGDLNDRKIEHSYRVFDAEGKAHAVLLEMRFPAWELSDLEKWRFFLDANNDAAFAGEHGAAIGITAGLGAAKGFDVLTDATLQNDAERDDYLRRHWRDVLFVSFEVEFLPGGEKIVIENAALRIFGDAAAKSAATAGGMKALCEDKTPAGFIAHHRAKSLAAAKAVADAKAALHSHRNLDEDYCRIAVVEVQDVAVCADVEVAAAADIERIQARIWFEIERYCNPPVPFYTLQELLDAGVPVEAIFNGPALNNGFIKADDLQAAELKTELRASDIINRLMDIDGVLAVNNLLLTAYDAASNAVKGRADPDRESGAFDPNKISASWLLAVGERQQPRLNRNLSRFLFFKNGLPFLPRMDEANDTLTQLRGEAERPKIGNALKDLKIPAGTYRNPEDYFPLQYGFPLTYGIGPEGLPSHVSTLRRAQAKQLKAYLMVFEQLLGNALAQLAHTADLFSLDAGVTRTYFVREFSKAVIQGYDALVKAELLQQDSDGKTALKKMTETPAEFLQRRNRFLDHLLARFGEQFGEYALLLTNHQGRQRALSRLIDDKISFLNAYPLISRDRAKAFDYTRPPNPWDNQAGIKKRISLLLGHPNLEFVWTATDRGVDKFRLKFQLLDNNKKIWLGYITLAAHSEAEAQLLGYRAVIERMSSAGNYKIAKKADKFVLRLLGKTTEAHGRHLDAFATQADAEAVRDELLAWSANERMIVVEHLLLRPKFPGDALYPACSEGTCKTCGDEDPYSFRLTFAMPGWTALYKSNMDMRRFAERTIRQETPAHLLAKICWVDNQGFERFEDAWRQWLETDAKIDWTDVRLQERVTALLQAGLDPAEQPPAKEELCRCAAKIIADYAVEFYNWMQTNIAAGNSWQDFGALPQPAIEPCGAVLLSDATKQKITTLLAGGQDNVKAVPGLYAGWVEVSYRLWIVLDLLGRLRNIYPGATLHDCDDGSDANPVRLGATALGNYPLRTSA